MQQKESYLVFRSVFFVLSVSISFTLLDLQGEPGPAILIEELVKAAKKESPQTRAAAMGLLQTMCSKSSVDLTEHVPHLIIFTTEAFNDPSDAVCERAWLSLEALVKVHILVPQADTFSV